MVDRLGLFEELSFKDADAFVDALSASNDLWRNTGGIWNQNSGERNWIFRGQRRADWSLNPKAMRRDVFTHYGIGASAILNAETLSEQLQYEDEEFVRFVRRCIRAGLPIPEDSQWLRSDGPIDSIFKSQNEDHDRGIGYPFSLHRSLYALAQHHGVPTRLLDWTERPLIAAYFGCRKAAELVTLNRKRHLSKEAAAPVSPSDADTEGDLAVWAVRQHAFGYSRRAWRSHHLEPLLEVVEAPFESNPNLKAQRGLFTVACYRSARAPDDFRLPTLEDLVQKLESIFGQENRPWLRKLTVPQSQAPKLLRLLDGFDISASTIWPNYDGVVQAIREREFYE